MKKIFSDKRIKIVLISCLAIALIVIGGIYAARTIARNSSIGEDAAASFAYLDAEVESSDVTNSTIKFEYKDGSYVYIVKFQTDQAKYSYVVKASNGIILNKKVIKLKKTKTNKSDKKKHKKKKKHSKDKEKTTDEETYKSSTNYGRVNKSHNKVKTTLTYDEEDDYITVDKAKSIAQSSAGESSAVFTVAQMGTENGVDVYYVHFTAGNNEYQYVINAKSGSIMGSQKISHKETKKDDSGDNEGDDSGDDGDNGNQDGNGEID